MEFIINSDCGENIQASTSVRGFFDELHNDFAKETINFYEQWGLLPFSYSEKQVNSIIIPAIYKITKNIWLEQPFKIGDRQRFLDIATTHEGNTYLIELKHSWNSKNENISKRTNKEWETAIDQIATLRKSNVKQFINNHGFTIYKIALMVMPTYLTNDFNHRILEQSAEEYAKNIFTKYKEYRSERYRANYVSTWKIENYEEYAYEYNGGKQIFPFISFVAKIDKIYD